MTAHLLQIAEKIDAITESGRLFPSTASDEELAEIISMAAPELSFLLKRDDYRKGSALPSLLAIALAEQQRRLANESLEHSRQMTNKAAESANFATKLMWASIGIAFLSAVGSIIIGLCVLSSSGNWETKQMTALKEIEKRMPTTQPAKEN